MVINYTIHSKNFSEGSALVKDSAFRMAKFRESKGDLVMIIENKRNESNLIYQTTK